MSHSQEFYRAEEPTRRAFLSGMAKGVLGLSALPVLSDELLALSARASAPATARSVIFLYMFGGMSHLDTFDPKFADGVQGPVEPISTNADGVFLSGYLQAMARQMDKVCVINSMHSSQGAHLQGRYYTHTGYKRRGTISHPSLGAWASQLTGRLNPSLPSHVEIAGSLHTASAGFLDQSHGPLPIADASLGLQNAVLADRVSETTNQRRLARLHRMNREFGRRYDQGEVSARSDVYDQALRLMNSRDLTAFDITREPESLRDAYGRTEIGQGALLARRLVEHGVRYVEVVGRGWDSHFDNFGEMGSVVPKLDRALASLLADLDSRGMLEETLVVLTTEFGRTPFLNGQHQGRDHHPAAFSSLLAGGGIQGGRSYGKTDATGSNIIENPVSFPDFNATIAHALGLPLNEAVYSPSGRPFTVTDKGKPLVELFA